MRLIVCLGLSQVTSYLDNSTRTLKHSYHLKYRYQYTNAHIRPFDSAVGVQ